ncbi:thiamine-phosphate kinase [Mycobacterium sp. CBMA293]|uniref:thiamine-phosphate kinase n=1 Tax=unclassified Mycolicibacterium TaxID=2636767 RepID=UPI0012DBF24A|nr:MULTISPECIES: thiamine-phosphate kinase [unclassified Mycolicibacterium]MUL45085.1 thiamine-phosphate kinase [Mycolicibacterium sp. CBMA 360]MUL57801.1 thiamine-phosphate kinase [Mycolicibacterium sp. CBMA 335]MUL72750.1 thiamine-phosphate kinase [Mycolicibacterium sp. CBMA 311]MUL97383.1 thiamine-phosphate kinase [Mycolicibacterium sp. CBMA 230]MUM07231.1 thiamine-phosphate kinase [Mycolicibacterium sp. CBMA 213]
MTSAHSESGETLARLGEFAVIDRLNAGRTQPVEVTVGPGDDAAVLSAPDGRVVVSTDMLVEARHFRLDWSTPEDVGRKAIAQNAADIEAMGARAYAFVVGFGAPADTPAAAAQQLSDGMWSEATIFGAGIVGGDLVAAPQWVISVTVLGDLGGRSPVLLSGARPGDTVAVVGDVGWSAAGYALWRGGIHEFSELRRRHLVPQLHYGQGVAAAVAGATAMTDVSDGLLADLGHIAQASGVTVDLSMTALEPDVTVLAPAAAMVGADARGWVLGGGEDHVLVATFSGALPVGWRAIGTVLPGEPRVTVDGAPWQGVGGWESFGQ